MERLVKGDVVILEFPFSDLKNSKRRPALIIKVPDGGDVIVCQMTGFSYEKSVEISVKNEDFKQGGLKREGQIRIDKIASIEKSLVKYKAGSLKIEKFGEVLDRLTAYLKS